MRLFAGRLRAARHVLHDRWAEYVPTRFASFQPFAQYPPTSQLPEFGWQAQLTLGWSIYDGGLRHGLEHERAAVTREAEVQLESGQREAQADVRAADQEVRRSAASLAAARDAARLAAESTS